MTSSENVPIYGVFGGMAWAVTCEGVPEAINFALLLVDIEGVIVGVGSGSGSDTSVCSSVWYGVCSDPCCDEM